MPETYAVDMADIEGWRKDDALAFVKKVFPKITPEGELIHELPSNGSHEKKATSAAKLEKDAMRVIFYPTVPSMASTTLCFKANANLPREIHGDGFYAPSTDSMGSNYPMELVLDVRVNTFADLFVDCMYVG
jgi:hypothetical protein